MSRVRCLALMMGLLASGGLSPADVRGEGPDPCVIDLLEDRDAWSSWAARPEIARRFDRESQGGPRDRPVLVLSGGGNDDACGCWRRPLPTLREGRRYLLEVAFRAEDVAVVGHNAWALVARDGHEFAELAPEGVRDGWSRMALDAGRH